MKNASIVLFLLVNGAFAYSQEWNNDLKAAFKEASVSGKDVLLLFSVSEDCNSCNKLDKNVLQSEQFQQYARENFILVKQDFSSSANDSTEENLLVVEKYNKDGFFPLLVVINKNSKIVGQIGAYDDETAQEYISKFETIRKS